MLAPTDGPSSRRSGVWLFADNDDYFGGRRREQDPLASMQARVRQSNSRIGLTLSLPIGRTQSLKFSWSEGATTRIGSDFTAYGIAWQYTRIP